MAIAQHPMDLPARPGTPRRTPEAIAWVLSAAICCSATPAVAGEAPEEDPPVTLQALPVDRLPSELAASGLVRSDYEIGRQDLLEIKVFDVEELNQIVRVADDGSITMPLLGRLEVAGLTKTRLERLIAELLEERFVHDPQVTVFVKEYESKKVAVSGAVKSPGSYEMLGRKTLLEMLSVAGGLDRDLGSEIVIFRQDPSGAVRRIAVDLDELVYEANPELNLPVAPGDIIYVPTVEKVRIYVSGAVRSPDVYEVPREEQLTLLRAITLAGGTTDRAAIKHVQIMRNESGERVTLEVNLKAIKRGRAEDPPLRRDDVVLVPESFF